VYTGSQIFDKEKIKEYITLSASTFYQIRPNVQLFIQLNNILGKKYQIAPGYPGKPFNFIAGFQTRW
ncbi:MAG: TonB-dependent receptor, partial [Candidatus Omnitrophica bacterium]|nr:TonB-dependent receptor [Candidatus Omnitrophota bacterium]